MYKAEDGKWYLNADDEEPDCMKCLNVGNGSYTDHDGKKKDFCSTQCGPEHGWAEYCRCL